MWPYACLSDCKVMVKCVESDGKVIATHVSSCMRRRQVTKLPIGSIRCQRCWVGGIGFIRCHRLPLLEPSCVVGRVIRVCPIARMYASVTVLGRWDRFHSLPPAATPGTFMCCHGACIAATGQVSFDLIAMRVCSLRYSGSRTGGCLISECHK